MRDPKNLVILGLSVACALLVGLVLGSGGQPAWAQQGGAGNYGAATVSQNARYIAATGSVGSGMSVLWVVDTEAKRVVVYGTSSLGKSVELRAARNIEWDLRLDEYNDESQYKAEDLERLARRQKRGEAGNEPVEAASDAAGDGAGDASDE